jgi:hypothetical protein
LAPPPATSQELLEVASVQEPGLAGLPMSPSVVKGARFSAAGEGERMKSVRSVKTVNA